MARDDASELARRLGRRAEAVCRHYLPAGYREGRYWLVGDVRNTPGRSMFVRLRGPESGRGAAGKWTDAASGEYGDLLDVIREARGLSGFKDVAEEARSFLSLPDREPERPPTGWASAPAGSPEAARRLIAMSRPIAGTIAATYLRARGITALQGTGSLRFHPRCYYRPNRWSPSEAWPAMIAAVTDLEGRITGVQRTWLNPTGEGKAPIATPRRAMGDLLGHAVRFGLADDCLVAGEGIETVLSLRTALADLHMAAALSAAHLAAIRFPATLRRLYIARDEDAAGRRACRALAERAEAAGIEAIALSPQFGDFNEDLRILGSGALRAAVSQQLAPEDASRILALAA